MKLHATRWTRTFFALGLLAALTVLSTSRAQAQVDPNWDHYKAYLARPIIAHSEQVTLVDQFQVTTQLTQYLDWFANPVEKIHDSTPYPIHRPELHYTWWALNQLPFDKDVIAINQFGEQPIHVGQSAYLLNPALKNSQPGTPLPVANHYKCYECTGPPVNATVLLTDQFLTRPAQVLIPRFFCTPVEKRTVTGQIYPIVDPKQHYTVYDMDFTTQIFPATITDQFIPNTQIELNVDRLLMVPTDKVIPTDAKSTTWGRVRGMYR